MYWQGNPRRSIISNRHRPWSVGVGLGLFAVLSFVALTTATTKVWLPFLVSSHASWFDPPQLAAPLAISMVRDSLLSVLAFTISLCLTIIAIHHALSGRRSGRNVVTILAIGISAEAIISRLGLIDILVAFLVTAGIIVLLWWPRWSRHFFGTRDDLAPRRHVLHFWLSLAVLLLVLWQVFDATVSPVMRAWVNRPDFATSARITAAIQAKFSSIDIAQLIPSRIGDLNSWISEIVSNTKDAIAKQVQPVVVTAFTEDALGRLAQLGYLLAFAAVVVTILGMMTELSKPLIGHSKAIHRDGNDARVRILRWELREDGWYALCLNQPSTGGVYLVENGTFGEPVTQWVKHESLEPAFPVTIPAAVREVARSLLYAIVLVIFTGCAVAVADAATAISAEYYGLNQSLHSPQLDPLARSQLQAQISTASSDIVRGAVTTTLSVAAVMVAAAGLVATARRRRQPVTQEGLLKWTEIHTGMEVTARYDGLVSVDRVRCGRDGWEGYVRAQGRIGVRSLGWFPLIQISSPPADVAT